MVAPLVVTGIALGVGKSIYDCYSGMKADQEAHKNQSEDLSMRKAEMSYNKHISYVHKMWDNA